MGVRTTVPLSSTVTRSPTFASLCLVASRSTDTITSVELVWRTATAEEPPSPDPEPAPESDAPPLSLPPELSHRLENHCYEAGHITYRDDAARPKFLGDLSSFIRKAAAAQPAAATTKR